MATATAEQVAAIEANTTQIRAATALLRDERITHLALLPSAVAAVKELTSIALSDDDQATRTQRVRGFHAKLTREAGEAAS